MYRLFSLHSLAPFFLTSLLLITTEFSHVTSKNNIRQQFRILASFLGLRNAGENRGLRGNRLQLIDEGLWAGAQWVVIRSWSANVPTGNSSLRSRVWSSLTSGGWCGKRPLFEDTKCCECCPSQNERIEARPRSRLDRCFRQEHLFISSLSRIYNAHGTAMYEVSTQWCSSKRVLAWGIAMFSTVIQLRSNMITFIKTKNKYKCSFLTSFNNHLWVAAIAAIYLITLTYCLNTPSYLSRTM